MVNSQNDETHHIVKELNKEMSELEVGVTHSQTLEAFSKARSIASRSITIVNKIVNEKALHDQRIQELEAKVKDLELKLNTANHALQSETEEIARLED